jgi:hypothetical protein
MSCDNAHVAQVREIVQSNRRLTVRKIAEERNISIGSCHDISMTISEMHRVVSDTGLERQLHCHLSGTSGLC